MENRKKSKVVSPHLTYRDEYQQHFISLEVDDGHEPVFINVTVKSNDHDRLKRAMDKIQEFMEKAFA
jgi:hypothetical protein